MQTECAPPDARPPFTSGVVRTALQQPSPSRWHLARHAAAKALEVGGSIAKAARSTPLAIVEDDRVVLELHAFVVR